MAGITFDLSVQLDGEEQYEVRVDQRDVAAWELESFGCPVALYPTKVYTFARYLAWHHAKRTKRTKLNWPNWNDACEWVDIEDDSESGDDSTDPGQPAPPAGT